MAQNWGVMISDVTPMSPSAAAGLQVEDILVSIDGKPVENLDSGLMMGDTIHRINATAVSSVDDLRTAIDNLKPRSAVALQIERNGQLSFLAFELD